MSASYAQLANPPNLMSLYLQMQAKQSAEDGINRGLALITANHSPPSMREAIMQSMTGGPDAGQQVNNLMSLYNAQQGMAARQQEMASAPDIAAKTGLPISFVQGEIAAGRGGELMRGMEPTDMQKNYAWARKTYADAHPGASPDDIDQGAQGILLGVGGMGGGDSATRSWRAAKIQWDQNPATKGTPYPWGSGADDSPTSFAAWQTNQKTQEAAQANDMAEAASKRPGYVQNLTGLRDKITDITGPLGDDGKPTDPNKAALLQSVMQSPFAQSYLRGDPSSLSDDALAWVRGLSQPQKSLLGALKDVTDTTNPNNKLGTINKVAPKRGVSDVTGIGTGLQSMGNINKPYDEWLNGVGGTLKAIDTATGNAFGASGEAESAPENTKKYIDPSYLFGGQMYPKGKQPLTPSSDQLAEAQQKLTAAKQAGQDPEDVRSSLIQYFLTHNLNPSQLKKMAP